MSENYIIFAKDEDLPYQKKSFDFLNMYDDVRVIAEGKDNIVLGVYDPQMYYYIRSTKFIIPKWFRYFSDEDYENKNKVGIAIVSIEDIKRKGFDNKFMDEVEVNYDFELINLFDRNSVIADKHFQIIKNLFAMDEEISKIYIDSHNIKTIKNVGKNFKSLGYKELSTKNTKDILSLLSATLESKRYVQYMVISIACIYLMLISGIFIGLFKYDRYIYISRVSGASIGDIFRRLIKIIMPVSIIMSVISILLALSYLKFVDKIYISEVHLIQIQGFLFFSLWSVLFIKYFLINLKIKRIMR
ncbi:hypothetical protein I6I92_02845 [Peptoniphilus asaccharolyticus]|nr:hypothetical protein [Peptoniphilus asaccharolyticus]MBL7574784.1 hypothetical protein [Peptoniphilus asaccharolyticus]